MLWCAGCSLLLLSLFYLVIDVWRFRAWTLPLVVIGSNSILIYMAPDFIDFGYTANSLFGGVLKHTHDYKPLLLAIAVCCSQVVDALFLLSQADFSESVSRDSRPILSLKNRQQLVRCADREDHQRRCIRIAISAIAFEAFSASHEPSGC